MAINAPLFVTGVYRSGTTLVSRIFDAHSDYAVTYDSVHYMRFCYGAYHPLNLKKNRDDLVEDIKERCQSRWMRRLQDERLVQELDASTQWDDATVYDAVMRHFLSIPARKPQWGEKTLMAWNKIPNFLEMFPHGKALLVLRDPRDAALSQKLITYEPGLRYLDTAFATLNAMRAADAFEYQLPTKQYATVIYEDLVSQPEMVLRKICDRLEVDFDPLMLDARNFRDYTGGPWLANTSFESDAPIMIESRSVGRFRDDLSATDIQFIEMICRPLMARWGYELIGQFPTQEDWAAIYDIVADEFISDRIDHWLKTSEGVDVYPSSPPRRLRDEPGNVTEAVKASPLEALN